MLKDEFRIDQALVRRLLASQFPQWSNLPFTPVRSAGTDNAILRLGDARAVRIPAAHWAAGHAEKEQRWLPVLAPQLPLEIPSPIAVGAPAEGYPWPWSIFRWIEGRDARAEPITDLAGAASTLARFLTALQQIDATDAPLSGMANSLRGAPLALLDGVTRKSLDVLQDAVNTHGLLTIWEAALAAPAWSGPPTWVHGDLHPGNLLVRDGEIVAVIDFGLLGAGDPACDLMAAWTVLSRESRPVFRAGMALDDPAWTRGRGWALYFGVVALSVYQHSNPALADICRRTLSEVLAD